MSREKPGFRDNIAQLNERFPEQEMLTPADVAVFTGLTVQTVRRRFPFNAATRRITKAELARLICAR